MTDRLGAGEEQTLLDGEGGAGEFVERGFDLREFTRAGIEQRELRRVELELARAVPEGRRGAGRE